MNETMAFWFILIHCCIYAVSTMIVAYARFVLQAPFRSEDLPMSLSVYLFGLGTMVFGITALLVG